MSGENKPLNRIHRKAPRGATGFFVLLACAILVPLAFFAVGASSAWKAAEDEVLLGAERISNLLHEHALRTFETHAAFLAALDQRVAGLNWSGVAQSERDIQAFASALKKTSVLVGGLALLDPAGEHAASSFDAADVPQDLRTTAFLDAVRLQTGSYLPGPSVPNAGGGSYQSLIRARAASGGPEQGYVVSFYAPAVFESFYESLLNEPGDSIALLQTDGQIVARSPDLRGRSENALEERVTDMMRRSGRATASLRMQTAEGQDAIFVARRVGAFPFYIVYGHSLAGLPARWLLSILPSALLWLTSTTFLLFLTWRTAQATRREQEAYASLAVETANSDAKTEANLRMTRMMDANVFGVVTFSENGVVQANDAFLRIAGRTPADFSRDGFVWKDRAGVELHKDERLLTPLRERGACPPFETEIVQSETQTVPVLIGATLYDRSPFTWICFVLDLTERREREAQQIFVMRELNHRTKNLLTVIRSVAGQIARTAKGWDDFRERFNSRLTALASAHDLLVESNWRGASLQQLIHSQFSQFHDLASGQLVTEGEDINLSPRAAQAIGMALYELMTNAVKYGALVTPAGQIQVSWEIAESDEPTFHMHWKELHGPAVHAPEHRGFGHIVIADMTSRSLCGDVKYDFEEDGVSWRLDAPLEQIMDKPDPLSLESASRLA